MDFIMIRYLQENAMGTPLHKPGYWTQERVFAEAKNYSTPSDFWKYARGAATKATKKGYYREAISHMALSSGRPHGFYRDLDNIFEAYRKATSLTDLNKSYLAAVNMAKKLGIHSMLASPFQRRLRWAVIGNIDRIKAVSKLYDNVNEFALEEPGAYSAASKLGILLDVTKHMSRKGNLYRRFVYQVINNDYVYIGLTTNVDNRLSAHRKSADPKRKKLFNSPDSKIVISKLIDAQEARLLEARLIQDYQKEGRLEVLNKHSGGGLGSPCRVETVEEIMEKAKGKTSRYLKKHHPGTYKSICKLSGTDKEKVKKVMKRMISKKMTSDEVFNFCKDKTMRYIRDNYPSVRKRIYSHSRKSELMHIMHLNSLQQSIGSVF